MRLILPGSLTHIPFNVKNSGRVLMYVNLINLATDCNFECIINRKSCETDSREVILGFTVKHECEAKA